MKFFNTNLPIRAVVKSTCLGETKREEIKEARRGGFSPCFFFLNGHPLSDATERSMSENTPHLFLLCRHDYVTHDYGEGECWDKCHKDM